MGPASSPHVLIIGAGLGGMTLAQTLRKQGITFEIFEREENDDARQQGWVIGLHGMLDDLKASIPDDMPPIAQVNHLLPLDYAVEFAWYSLSGVPDAGKVGVRDDGSGNIIRAPRRRLRQWLSTNILIQWGKRAARIEEDKESVTVYFEDGSSARGDILIGAEGARSTTRNHILKGQDPIPRAATGVVGGTCTLSGQDLEEQLRLGHSCYLVDMPPVHGSPMFLFVALHEMLPDGKAGEYCFFIMWPDVDAARDDFWTWNAGGEQLRDFAMQKSRELPAKFRTVIESSTPMESPLRFWALAMDSLPTGRITLLGDAAHAMPPFRGEGGYHALQDALNLSRAIAKIDKDDNENIKELFGGYQAEMLERGAKASRLSAAAFSQSWDSEDSGAHYSWGQPVVPFPED